MSKILKSSYITINDSVTIDNTFAITQKVNKEVNQELLRNEMLLNTESTIKEEKQPKISIEEIQNLKEKVLVEAEEEAQKIVALATLEAEDFKTKAKKDMKIQADQVYKEAYEKGYEEGKQKADEDCEAMRQEAKNIITQTKQERENTINNLEPEIIKFIIDTTQNILTTSFEFNPQMISLLIKKGLLSVKDIKNLKVLVSEESYEYVEENKQQILGVDTEKNNIEIIKDITLKNTDCLIETEIGTIQCFLDDQLSSIKEALYYILN